MIAHVIECAYSSFRVAALYCMNFLKKEAKTEYFLPVFEVICELIYHHSVVELS